MPSLDLADISSSCFHLIISKLYVCFVHFVCVLSPKSLFAFSWLICVCVCVVMCGCSRAAHDMAQGMSTSPVLPPPSSSSSAFRRRRCRRGVVQNRHFSCRRCLLRCVAVAFVVVVVWVDLPPCLCFVFVLALLGRSCLELGS